MAKILYIKKKANTVKWSDVLQRQFEDLKHLSGGNVDLYEVDTAGLLAYWKNIRRIGRLMRQHEYTVVYVNHVICAYPFVLSRWFYRKKGVTTVLALHETEPVLGWQFVREHRDMLSAKEKVRYTKFLQWPLPFFDTLLVLNNRQRTNPRLAQRYVQHNYLGVDVERFGALGQEEFVAGERFHVFFPHNPERPEKGFGLLENAVADLPFAYDLTVGGNIPYPEMPAAYRKSHVVMLTGMYETYSLVLLEAMAADRFIIATNVIGLVENLRELFTVEELEAYGLFVVNPTPVDVRQALERVQRVATVKKPATKALLLQEKLTEKDCNERLYKFLTNFQRLQSSSHA
ncbi:glycosyltransferase [Fulvivirgaceae bacterium PWU5]|uniref:Glycosyltransferase n=1 Tax=Dawidia cretensis TaxID=2782350 RepID=A0AAP2E4P1_9BACT|nr:glycosyltransferase [Dawidia cretensis]MBT1712203.1 glycosyltransferase [Dawidia cretensis]